MSVLIKGMEMPERCVDCRFCDEIDGTCIALNDDSTACITGKPKWCPLIEQPPEEERIYISETEYETMSRAMLLAMYMTEVVDILREIKDGE